MTPERTKDLLQQYGVGPIQFSGSNDALYERHLTFDNVVDVKKATVREQFEAAAHAIRDIVSQRWLLTEKTYAEKNPKRVYYLSMEFLLGRSFANNITNALLHPLAAEAAKNKGLDPLAVNEMEPDAGLGNGGLGRLAACFIDSMATMEIPGMGYGLRYEYGIFKQTIVDGWQREQPDNWLRRPDPWEVVASGRSGRGKTELYLRASRGHAASHHRSAVGSPRHPVRSSGHWLRGENHQYASAMGGGHAGYL